MNKEQTKKSQIKSFDYAFINPWIDNVVEAISLINKGVQVIIIISENLDRNDYFQITTNYPSNIFDLLVQIKETNTWKKFFTLAPHLVQNNKIYYSSSSKWRKISDIILRNHFTKKSTQVNLKNSGAYSFLAKEQKGVLFHEYKININRLYIELLKYFESIGGIVKTNEAESKRAIKIIQCKNESSTNYQTDIQVPENFDLVFQKKGAIIRLFEKNKHLHVELLNAKAKKLSHSEILGNTLKVVSFDARALKSYKGAELISFETVKNIIKVIDKPFIGCIKDSTMEENYELGLEKFDIAKQTGITYPEFKPLFQRYGAGIDEMTEDAYELMNKIRNPKKIWKLAEDNFQKKYEWKN